MYHSTALSLARCFGSVPPSSYARHRRQTPPATKRRPVSVPIIVIVRYPAASPRRSRIQQTRCSTPSSGGAEQSHGEDAVAGMVEDLLGREENRALLEGLEEASRRVDRAREALADIEKQEADALRAKEYVRQLESRRSEIDEYQRELLEARAMVEEAERSLSSNMDDMKSGEVSNEGKSDIERWESVKAASVSSIIGILAGLPITFYQASSYTDVFYRLTTILISCALFGVTFRYTIRRDVDNFQLKTGTCAAFGFVKGLGALEAGKRFEPNLESLVSRSTDGALYVTESVVIFLFSAIALDFCFKMNFLSPFPIKK